MVRQDHRGPFAAALHRARASAYPPGQYIGQESFMIAEEIRELAHRAGIGPCVRVLDLCCGVAGPGRMITAELDCHYLGVDYSASAVQLARDLAGALPCRFEQRRVPPLPHGRFDVVLLLETMLAFRDKRLLLQEVARALEPGGRFVFTLEEGPPLSPSELARMPDADTVWLIELAQLTTLLHETGLTITWQQECTASHRATATALLHSFRADTAQLSNRLGQQAVTELILAHQLWSEWLGTGRVRKFAVVAEKSASGGHGEDKWRSGPAAG